MCGRNMIPTHNSCALVMEAAAYCLEYPGAEAYLFRETYDDLEANLIREWKSKIPRELYTYNESKHQATLLNGSVVKFRYIRNYQDAERYQGRSMDFIGVDELTKHEEKSIQELLSCLRSAKGFPPRFRGTCNPGGIGHVWVKKRYISPTLKGKKYVRDKITGNWLAYIPATVYDNEVLMENDPSYVRRLENLPPAKRKAFLLGDWDVYEGQAFEEFSESIHVCKPFPIPEHWYRWRSADNGYTDPFAFYWFAVDERGTVYIYREFTRDYGDPKIIYSEQAQKVVELSKYTDIDTGETRPEKIAFTVIGHDAFNVHPMTKSVRDKDGKSIADYYEEGGLTGLMSCIPDRRLRKATWHEYLKPYYDENEGRWTAKVQIFSTCKKLIETLPQQMEDEEDSEKVAESNYDHWYDGAGYGLIAYHVNKSRPLPEDKGKIGTIKQNLAKKAAMHRMKRRIG